MVLQYADGGTLREYLSKNKNVLKWEDKLRICKEITAGLRCLHAEDIIHRDLHSKNILVHEGKMMIADLGISKRLDEDSYTSAVKGMQGYIDPACFEEGHRLDKRSDIYSLGILFWEITACRIPFGSLDPMKGTPKKFIELYNRCWKGPEERPDVNKVFEILQSIPTQNNSRPSIIPVNDNIYQFNESPTNGPLLDYTDFVSAPEPFITPLNLTGDVNIQILPENTNNASILLKTFTELYVELIRIGSDKAKNNYDHWATCNKEYLSDIVDLLSKDPDLPHRDVMLGQCMERGFGADRSTKLAFSCYKEASLKDDMIGHYKVGYCYFSGSGTDNNYREALEHFEIAAEKGLVGRAKHMLGIMHHSGYGTERDIDKAFKMYLGAARHNFVPAQYWLADCYVDGNGAEKNEHEALNWYKKCVNNGGYSDAEDRISELRRNSQSTYDFYSS